MHLASCDPLGNCEHGVLGGNQNLLVRHCPGRTSRLKNAVRPFLALMRSYSALNRLTFLLSKECEAIRLIKRGGFPNAQKQRRSVSAARLFHFWGGFAVGVLAMSVGGFAVPVVNRIVRAPM